MVFCCSCDASVENSKMIVGYFCMRVIGYARRCERPQDTISSMVEIRVYGHVALE